MVSEDVAEKFGIRHVVDRVMETREVCRRRFADVGNGERVKPARKRESFCALDRLDGFGGVLLTKNARSFIGPKIQFGELLYFQLEQIERLAHQSALNQFVRDNASNTFDIERAAGREKFQSSRRLCRTLEVFAAPSHKFRIAPDLTATNRAFGANMFQEIERFRLARALRFHDLDDGGNHFAGLFDHYRVADANVFSLNLLLG